MGPTCHSPNVRCLFRSIFSHHQRARQLSVTNHPRAPLLTVMRPAGWVAAAICVSFVMLPQTPMAAADAQANRIRVEYFRPINPALLPTYELVKERRVLEKLQQIFSPFRLPVDLTIKMGDCQGVSNAWYDRPAISICYEYLNEVLQSIPQETTPEGITPADAAIGQFFYVAAHEMGHAAFDLYGVPMFANAEDAADHFATYIMLQFGKEQARRLIAGAAYSYRRYVQSSQVTVPLAAFSEAHAAPTQRFFNILCLAFGADPILFADLVDKGHLPKDRARSCKREYDQVAYAFQELIVPHIDQQLARQVLDRTWLPDVNARAPRK
jgi:hypothetical protein